MRTGSITSVLPCSAVVVSSRLHLLRRRRPSRLDLRQTQPPRRHRSHNRQPHRQRRPSQPRRKLPPPIQDRRRAIVHRSRTIYWSMAHLIPRSSHGNSTVTAKDLSRSMNQDLARLLLVYRSSRPARTYSSISSVSLLSPIPATSYVLPPWPTSNAKLTSMCTSTRMGRTTMGWTRQ